MNGIYPVYCGVTLQQGGKTLLNHPTYLAGGSTTLQTMGYGQGMDNIAQRTLLNNQDAFIAQIQRKWPFTHIRIAPQTLLGR